MQHARRGIDEGHLQPATAERPTRQRRPISPLTVLGVILLAAGLACLGWVGWQYFGTTIVSKQEAAREISNLEASWREPVPAPTSEPPADPGTPGATAPPAAPEKGTAQWLLRIPALGDDWEWPVVAGVEDADLKRGVGWYPGTAQPGDVGNFALAGHRITHGEPFRRMLELDIGDVVIVETSSATWTYELVVAPGMLTVQDTETWVLDPVPGKKDVQPSEALITLTTCEDLFHSPDRSVAFGKLISTETK